LRRPRKLPRTTLTEAQALRPRGDTIATHGVGQRNRALLETLYGTGIRLSECVCLDLTDLGDGKLPVRCGKGRKDRLLPLPARVAAALDLYLRDGRPRLVRGAPEPALFVSHDGRRLKPISVQFVVWWHARHIQELLGHERLDGGLCARGGGGPE
jgi:site-specific recombinase XerD